MISISGKKSRPRLAVLRQDGGSSTRPARFVGRFCVLFSALRGRRGDHELLRLLGRELVPLLVDVNLFVLVPLQLLPAALLLLVRHRISMPLVRRQRRRP